MCVLKMNFPKDIHVLFLILFIYFFNFRKLSKLFEFIISLAVDIDKKITIYTRVTDVLLYHYFLKYIILFSLSESVCNANDSELETVYTYHFIFEE